MNRVFKTIRNIVFIGLLLFVFLVTTGLRLTPMQAHKASETSIHYGPSEVIKVFGYGNYQHLLCTYDKWVSCNTVRRDLLFFWRAGSQPTGFENDTTKAIDYSWHYSRLNNEIGVVLYYGIVNDPKITKVVLYTDEDSFFVQEELVDNLFYFSWEMKTSVDFTYEKIEGYDSEGNLVEEFRAGY